MTKKSIFLVLIAFLSACASPPRQVARQFLPPQAGDANNFTAVRSLAATDEGTEK